MGNVLEKSSGSPSDPNRSKGVTESVIIERQARYPEPVMHDFTATAFDRSSSINRKYPSPPPSENTGQTPPIANGPRSPTNPVKPLAVSEIEVDPNFGTESSNLPEGKEVKVVYDLGVYTGFVRRNLMHGKGIFAYTNGESYEGDFVDGEKCGFGKFIATNFGKYEGEFKANFKNGKGKEEFPNGDVYDGEFKDNRREGKGTYTYGEGKGAHSGIWKKDQLMSGQGLVRYKYRYSSKELETKDNESNFERTGDEYEGNFSNGLFNGQGKLTYQDGDTYDGEFLSGKKHGQGTYSYKGKGVHKGAWEFDQEHGEGEYTDTDKITVCGKWFHGVREGKFIRSFPNGNREEGIFKEGKENGVVTLTKQNGEVIEQVWLKGKITKSVPKSPKKWFACCN